MSAGYQAVTWNRQKRLYDSVMAGGILGFVGLFAGISLQRPDATLETALIRALGAAAFLLLHIILIIGPLARLDRRFLPLLYNRRHMGVTMALLALGHAAFATIQYHAAGDTNAVVSVLMATPALDYPTAMPFELFGVAALLIITLMAATSHDYWLSILTPPVWKSLHMLVYVAWGLLVLHVALGILQAEPTGLGDALVIAGVATVIGLHVLAGVREWRRDGAEHPVRDGWVDAGPVEDIPDGTARGVMIGGERVAVFHWDGCVSAVSGVCRHQNGPLAEGRVIDGCITCPWHGYQYYPDSGRSPPPFEDRIATYDVRVRDGRIYVSERANPPGTRVEPARTVA